MKSRQAAILPRRARAFVLLEVVLAITILGVSSFAFMRSFTQSMHAARVMEVQTQAALFARQLSEEFEYFPPEEGESVGGFGDAYRNYSYRVTLEYEEPDYDEDNLDFDAIEQFFPMRRLIIEIIYDDGRAAPYSPITLETALVGFEPFSVQSKRSYYNY